MHHLLQWIVSLRGQWSNIARPSYFLREAHSLNCYVLHFTVSQ